MALSTALRAATMVSWSRPTPWTGAPPSRRSSMYETASGAPARQVQPVLGGQQERDAPLARLAVDADDGVVAAAEVGGIDRQVGDVPARLALARGEALLDRVLVRAGEGGEHQVAHVGVARV